MTRRLTHSRSSIPSFVLPLLITGLVGCGSTESSSETGGAGGGGGSGGGGFGGSGTGGSAACTPACGVGQTCSAGACVCIAGRTSCPGITNACFDLTSDGSHCGDCVTACSGGQLCSQGQCGTSCPTGTTPCGASCANLTSDDANCGQCGTLCTGGRVCQNSTCACTSGEFCGSACTNTLTDGSNCGYCGNACLGGQTCQNGSCVGGGTGGAGTGGGGGVTGGGGPTGGSGPTGGRTGRGGAGGGVTGGSGPTGGRGGGGGGVTGTGGTTSGTGGGSSGECETGFFTINTTQSDTISTVWTVDWSASGAVDSAYIDFGQDANAYEYRATVDKPAQSGNKTMLLGMKPGKTYSFQIVATAGGTTHTSCAQQVTAGAIRSGLPQFDVKTAKASSVEPGFSIGCFFGMSMGGGGSKSWTFILDKDGEYVWWYQGGGGGDCVRSRMSYDGQYMWIANGNVPGPSSGTLVRVRMDGTNEKSYSVPNRHHDVAILPDETVAYMEYTGGNANGCDSVKELNPETGATKNVLDVQSTGAGSATQCHSNAINWWPDKNLYTLSVMNWNCIIGFERSGNVSWIFGGSKSTYTGDNMSWNRQHNHHLLDSGIVLFNNSGSNGGSSIREFTMSGTSATQIKDFANGHSTQSMGDVKRLSSGNTLITYSNQGYILEVDKSWETVREMSTDGVGYIERRKTLYGPPPPYAP
jgi:hypothetical protein